MKSAPSTIQPRRLRPKENGRKKKSEAHRPEWVGESHYDLARTGRGDDGARYRHSHQQKFGDGRREDSRFTRALQKNQPERPHEVVEPDAELRARTGEYDCFGASDHARRAGA